MTDNCNVVLNISEIKEAVIILLDHVTRHGIETLSLGKQFYWKVDDDEKYFMGKTPRELVVGDLSSDLGSVREILINKDQPVALSLTELAPLLAYIGEIAGQELAPKGG